MKSQPEDADIVQRLLELEYGLLEGDEARALRDRIGSEPALARLFDDVRRRRADLGKAARVSAEPISFSKVPVRVRRPWLRSTVHGMIAVAASLIAIFGLGSSVWINRSLDSLDQQAVVLNVAAPAAVSDGSTNQFEVVTNNFRKEPVSRDVEFQLISSAGDTVFTEEGRTDSQGRWTVQTPSNIEFSQVQKVRLQSTSASFLPSLSVPVHTEPSATITYLTSDREVYRPGETIYFRSVTLDRLKLRSAPSVAMEFELLSPRGEPVPGSKVTQTRDNGIASGSLAVAADQAGGRFQLVARSASEKLATRDIEIRSFHASRFKTDLEFIQDSFAPGERVVAAVAVEGMDGAPAAGARLTITASDRGEEFHRSSITTEPDGTSRLDFLLPPMQPDAQPIVAMTMDDGGTRETIARPIPVASRGIDLRFFPESGPLVAGVPTRVYFHALGPDDKPVTVEGNILDPRGNKKSEFKTELDGMGVFDFLPKLGESYRVELLSPKLPGDAPAFPAVSEGLLVLSGGAGVFAAAEPVRVEVRSARPEVPLVIAAECRGVPVAQSLGTTAIDPVSIALALPAEVAGVVQVTAFDRSRNPAVPVAERLVYRRASERLNIAFDFKPTASPADAVQLGVRVTDEKDAPAEGAFLGLSVVDRASRGVIRDRLAPHQTAHFLLVSQIDHPSDLMNIDALLDESPESERGLELVLGTHGWRGFAQSRTQRSSDATLPGEAIRPPIAADNSSEIQADLAFRRNELENRKSTVASATLWSLLILGAVWGVFASWSWWMRHRRSAGWTLVVATIALVAFAGITALQQSRAPANLGAPNDHLKAVAVSAQESKDQAASPPAPVPVSSLEHASKDAPSSPKAEMALARENQTVARRSDAALPPQSAADEPSLSTPAPSGQPAPPPPPAPPAPAAPTGDDRDVEEELARPAEEAAPSIATQGKGELKVADIPRNESDRENDDLKLADRIEGGGGAAKKSAGGEPEQGGEWRRVYAHRKINNRELREDFTPTVYWNPQLITDDQGRAQASFDLSDAVTIFDVTAEGHTDAGRLGSQRVQIHSRVPWRLEPHLVREATVGDVVEMPVNLHNDTDEPLTISITAGHDGGVRFQGPAEHSAAVAPRSAPNVFVPMEMTGGVENTSITIVGVSDRSTDRVRRRLSITPNGYPVSLARSGVLSGEVVAELTLPDDWSPSSWRGVLRIFPDSLSQLTAGLAAIAREPHATFEQAAASGSLSAQVLSVLKRNQGMRPDIVRQAREQLRASRYELTQGTAASDGITWFARELDSSSLASFGLAQLAKMNEARSDLSILIERSKEFLIENGQRKNSMSVNVAQRTSQDRDAAMTVWALARAGGIEDIRPELERLIPVAKRSDDPQLVSMVAEAIHRIVENEPEGGRTVMRQDAGLLLERLASMRRPDGSIAAMQADISREPSSNVVATALAALAWLHDQAFHHQATQAVDWLLGQRQFGGGFGTAHATQLAIEAIEKEAEKNKRAPASGTLTLSRVESDAAAGASVDRVTVQPSGGEATTFEVPASSIKPGLNRWNLAFEGEGRPAYLLEITGVTESPPMPATHLLNFSTKLDRPSVPIGETAVLSAHVGNAAAHDLPMVVASIGLPAGFEPVHESLEALKNQGVIDYYETQSRAVVLYWRSLRQREERELKLDLIASIPGRFTGPPSRSYVYYAPMHSHWAPPLLVEVTRPRE